MSPAQHEGRADAAILWAVQLEAENAALRDRLAWWVAARGATRLDSGALYRSTAERLQAHRDDQFLQTTGSQQPETDQEAPA